MPARQTINSLWWLIHKDFTCELRAWNVWPEMVLLGLVLVFLLATQLDLPMEEKTGVAGGLLWLAIFFAGTPSLRAVFHDRTRRRLLAGTRSVSDRSSVLFLAKMAVNLVALVVLELMLVPTFVVLSDVPFGFRPGPLLLIAALGNVGFAAVGTLVSGLTAGLRHRGGLLALLLLPLVIPVLFGSAEATRLLLAGQINSQWWLWIQLLAVFAIVFTSVGALMFEFVVEE